MCIRDRVYHLHGRVEVPTGNGDAASADTLPCNMDRAGICSAGNDDITLERDFTFHSKCFKEFYDIWMTNYGTVHKMCIRDSYLTDEELEKVAADMAQILYPLQENKPKPERKLRTVGLIISPEHKTGETGTDW